jgi:hypothetical protein
MSYRRTQFQEALGVDLTTIAQYAAKLPQYAGTIAEVIDDPYLPELACRIDQIYEARHHLPIKVCAVTPPQTAASGIGLGRGMPLIRAFSLAEQNPILFPLAAIVAIGLPILIGYKLGKRSSSSGKAP